MANGAWTYMFKNYPILRNQINQKAAVEVRSKAIPCNKTVYMVT
jgi:hypothetical protein